MVQALTLEDAQINVCNALSKHASTQYVTAPSLHSHSTQGYAPRSSHHCVLVMYMMHSWQCVIASLYSVIIPKVLAHALCSSIKASSTHWITTLHTCLTHILQRQHNVPVVPDRVRRLWSKRCIKSHAKTYIHHTAGQQGHRCACTGRTCRA